MSASALRAVLDSRAEALAAVRAGVIDARRSQVSLQERVGALEVWAGGPVAGAVAEDHFAGASNAWDDAGIVAGELARADGVNEVFTRFAVDLNNIRAFQALVLSASSALLDRIEALEASEAVLDPPAVPPVTPDDGLVAVPHAFTAGALMRASEMNANLLAIDTAIQAEAAVVASVMELLAVMTARIEVLEEVIEPRPTFTWRMGTTNGGSHVWTEAHFIFQNPGPFEPIEIHWTGPNGFELDVVVTDPNARSSTRFVDPLPSGSYLAQATVGGVSFELPIIFDAARLLGVPVVELSETATDRITGRVMRIEGAVYYSVAYSRVGGPSLSWLARGAIDEEAFEFGFNELDLDPAFDYQVVVTAATSASHSDPRLVPQQVDRSYVRTPPFTPQAPGD